jgi:peptidoglycan hydrolase CwlO-like protein
MEQKLDYEHRLTAVEDRAKSNARRLDEVEKRQNDLEKLTASVAELSSNQRHMEGDVKEIKADVKSLAAKPGKRWEAVADKALWAVLAAVIAFLLGRVGL